MSNISFTDKKGRLIEIQESDKGIIAIHEEEIIGEFDYDLITSDEHYNESDYYVLSSMNIKPDYQRAGIGTEMLKFGVEHYQVIQYPEDNMANYPTIEGAALLNAASSAGIIKLNNIHFDDADENDFDYYNSQFDLDTTPDHETLTRYEKLSGTINNDLNLIISDLLGDKVIENVTSMEKFIGEEDKKSETTDLTAPTKCDNVNVK